MKITVKVKPGAKEQKVQELGQNRFLVWIKARPVEGKANLALVKALAEYFDIPQSSIILLKGKSCKEKLFDILI
ncbi:MAG: DUF167 domain-containing protein [Candidatus Omnitrophica bacterium]|nr:DUF167 domain-containing protein [Candidatus Omnitrophota bacterium]